MSFIQKLHGQGGAPSPHELRAEVVQRRGFAFSTIVSWQKLHREEGLHSAQSCHGSHRAGGWLIVLGFLGVLSRVAASQVLLPTHGGDHHFPVSRHCGAQSSSPCSQQQPVKGGQANAIMLAWGVWIPPRVHWVPSATRNKQRPPCACHT